MKRLFALSILATLLLSVFFSTRASASFLDDFAIKEFDAVYNLSKKADGGSRIDVEWTIKADFPPNQNRGLVLEFIDKFNRRDTKLTIHSITDEYEVPVPYEIEGSNVLLGDNRFVSGLTTYVIRYSQ